MSDTQGWRKRKHLMGDFEVWEISQDGRVVADMVYTEADTDLILAALEGQEQSDERDTLLANLRRIRAENDALEHQVEQLRFQYNNEHEDVATLMGENAALRAALIAVKPQRPDFADCWCTHYTHLHAVHEHSDPCLQARAVLKATAPEATS